MPAIFQPRIAKKINKALSVRVILICSGHKHLSQDSYKGVGHASTLLECILHKIIIIIIRINSQASLVKFKSYMMLKINTECLLKMMVSIRIRPALSSND